MISKKNIITAFTRPNIAISKLSKKVSRIFNRLPTNTGYCVICKTNTKFIEYGNWLRDNYRCIKCMSIPRQRAFIVTLNQQFPQWRDLSVHESSPSNDFIKKECRNYSASQFYSDKRPGEQVGEFTCEDLTNLSFQNETFDLILTQDVFEHVLNPEPAFEEIARVLKPGGAHVFTMPWYPELQQTRIRAKELDNEIVYLEQPEYHRNPASKKGSLVTRDWGLDFPDIIFRNSGMITTIFLIRDRSLGIDGRFLEVFISKKSK